MAIREFLQPIICGENSRCTGAIRIKTAMGLLIGAIMSSPVLAVDLTTPESQKQLERSLTEQGINYTVMHEGLDSQRVIMSSRSNLQGLRDALYSSPVQQAFLRELTTITVSGQVPKDKIVELVLESNLATGYRWELADSASNILNQEGDSVYESRGLLGGNVKQIIRAKSTKEGNTETNLVYRRSWQQQDGLRVQTVAASAPNKIIIQLDEIPGVIDLSDPNAKTQNPPEENKKSYGFSTSAALQIAALPAALDWRTTGLTPVRDQGNCGSCWAFATVGALESALKVKSGSTVGNDVNASEQFLVSCNKNSYSCNGGWFAHDYHANTLGNLQTAAGAVLEADMPYTVSNGSCKLVANHPNRISSWSYIAGYAVPSVDQLKTAISNYGPVSAAVCVGSAFQSYRSGSVFSTDESAACGSSKVNHAIVLVGWDDATQSWILRNSWGPGWGEQGYMRIKYNTSNVGFGANYVQVAQGASQSISAISFSPAALTVGGVTTASATATSGLPVSFSSTTPNICSVNGAVVTGIAAGSCTVAANQAGDATYNAAPQVTKTFTVKAKTNQSISAISFSPAALTVSGVTTASATATSGLPVSFRSTTPNICSVNGAVVTGIAAGSCTVAANQAGDATYNAAPQVTKNITVSN